MSRFRARGADCGGIAVWNLVVATRKRKREEEDEEGAAGRHDGTSNKSCRAACPSTCCDVVAGLGQTQRAPKTKKKKEGCLERAVGHAPSFPLVLAPFALFLASKLVKDVVFLISHAFFFLRTTCQDSVGFELGTMWAPQPRPLLWMRTPFAEQGHLA